ncbi:MAG: hypothetical protein M3O80_02805 [Chloroflexota bacterium]|nr:hypothetical protein [Chloroflexota bacterium]
MTEEQAWAEVRSSLPGAPIILPMWLPPSVDRSRVQLRQLVLAPSEPRYVIAYVAPGGPELSIALGPTPDVRPGDSAIGTRVRNSNAALIYVGGWPATPEAQVPRKVRWVEGNYVLRIESERFTGDELLHVAWSLDRTGAPAPKTPYTRVKAGVCAARGAVPEDTVRRLIGLVGSGDRDAVLDCFSLELLGDYPGYYGWADLPRASDLQLQPSQATGGRVVIGAGWQFASNPGVAWAQQAHQFFLLGLEDGSWRVYETATAWYTSLP